MMVNFKDYLPLFFSTIAFLNLSGCIQKEKLDYPLPDLSDYTFAEDHLKLDVVVAEPLLDAPVALDWDLRGRMWVLELADYMPNIQGDENLPNSRISILEDTDKDGIIDRKTIVLDSMPQARAMALVYDGLLYAVPPFLYFSEIAQDKIVNTIIVDSNYVEGGNVEHASNSLTLNIDNWIYSAKCSKRYKRDQDGQWHIEPSIRRGQWGLTIDDIGRLYYNDNSNALYADQVIPDLVSKNPYFMPREIIHRDPVKDRSVYPAHVTAINRGYTDGALDADGKVRELTAVAGVLLYNSIYLGESIKGSVFVGVPEANAIKRVIINQQVLTQKGENAYTNTEFLRSTDEGFRPVNLYEGPDNALYVVDMHRGIIQHKTYMTSYLKNLIEQKGLDKITGMGRILRIAPNNASSYQQIDVREWSITQMIDMLKNENRRIRMTAHQMLINSKSALVKSQLRKAIEDANELTQLLHLLYIADALNELDIKDLIKVQEKFSDLWVNAHCVLLGNIRAINNPEEYKRIVNRASELNNEITDIHIALSISTMLELDNFWANDIMTSLVNRYPFDVRYANALAVAINTDHLAHFNKIIPPSDTIYQSIWGRLRTNIKNDRVLAIYRKRNGPEDARGLTEGRILFNMHCSGCHDMGGEGLANLAPSLIGAAVVNSPIKNIVKTILRGMTGSVTINGQTQTFHTAMPGLIRNPDISDQDIAFIANYVTNAFSTTPQLIKTSEVKDLRDKLSVSDDLMTEQEILAEGN